MERKKLLISISIMEVILVMIIVFPLNAQVATPDWPIFQGNLKHTGVSAFSGMHSCPGSDNLKWRFATSSLIYAFPIIGLDGTIYVADMGGKVYAFSSYGEINWLYDVGAGVRSTPVLTKEGLLVVANRDGFIYAFNSTDGIVKWVYVTGGRTLGAPVVDRLGRIVIGASDGFLYVLDSGTGIFEWKQWVGTIGPVSPCIDSANNIYMASREGMIYSFNSEGEFRWSYEIAGDPRSPSMDEDDVLYIPTKNGEVFACHSDGSLKWSTDVNYWIRASGALHPDGFYILPTYDQRMVSLDIEDGQIINDVDVVSDCEFPPVIGNDGTIYLGAMANYYALDPNSTYLWKQPAGTLVNVTPIMDAENNFIEIGDGIVWVYGDPLPNIELSSNDSCYVYGDTMKVILHLEYSESDRGKYDLKAWFKAPGLSKSNIFNENLFGLGFSSMEIYLFDQIIDESFPEGEYFIAVVLQDHITGQKVKEVSKIVEIKWTEATKPLYN